VDAIDLVDDVPQQVAVDHAVDGALEHRGHHVPPIAAIGPLQIPQEREESRAGIVGAEQDFLVVDKRDEFVTRDPVRLRRPVPPPVGRLDRGPKPLARHQRFLLAHLLHVVQELQEHDPGEHRQTVEVAVQALVLPHQVSCRLDKRAELLGRREGKGVLLMRHTVGSEAR
jgi:hypothetical protein